MKQMLKHVLTFGLSLGLCMGVAMSWAQDTGQAQSNYAVGVEAYREGDFRRAFDAWSLGAYEGLTEAQYNLGVLYLEGRGVQSNIGQARNWFLKAAEKGHVEAQYNLGHMALSGMGVEKSVPRALKWWQQAAEGGYAQAQFNYGRALYLGIEGRKDPVAGLEYIHRAAAQKDQRAISFLEQNVQSVALQSPSLTGDGGAAGGAAGKPLQTDLNDDARAVTEDTAELTSQDIDRAAGRDSIAVGSVPAPARLEIVRDQRRVQSEYLMRTVGRAVDVYPSAEGKEASGVLKSNSLVRVIGIQGDKLQVQTPASVGTSGWIQARNLAYTGESMQQLREAWAIQNRRTTTAKPPAPDTSVAPARMKQQTPRSPATKSKQVVKPESVGGTSGKKGETPTLAQSDLVQDMDDNTWLFTQAPKAHVIHLFTLLDGDKARSVAAQPGFRDLAHIYSTRVRDQEWVFVLLGPYVSEAAANSAKKSLPSAYRRDARVRSVKQIAHNRCAKRNMLSTIQAIGLDAFCMD